MVKQAIKFGAAFSASMVLMGAVASAGSTITTTGPGSVNVIVKANSNSNKKNCKVTNKNNVAVLNVTAQGSKTGKAKVKGNTTGGNATSGAATNSNATTLGVDVANNNVVDPCGGCGCNEVPVDGQGDLITTTGPGSWNVILNGLGGHCGCQGGGNSVKNVNNVLVGNLTLQGAKSGSAVVSGNTGGGDAISGNASNTNTSEIVVTVSNN